MWIAWEPAAGTVYRSSITSRTGEYSVSFGSFLHAASQSVKIFTPNGPDTHHLHRERLKDHFAEKEDVDRAYLDEHACEDCTLAPATEKGGMRAYWELKNSESVDGLPGLGIAGFPPKEGAIRKARKGVKVAYGQAANSRAAGGWVQEAKRTLGTEWRFELGLVAGGAVGMWLGARGWESLIPR